MARMDDSERTIWELRHQAAILSQELMLLTEPYALAYQVQGCIDGNVSLQCQRCSEMVTDDVSPPSLADLISDAVVHDRECRLSPGHWAKPNPAKRFDSPLPPGHHLFQHAQTGNGELCSLVIVADETGIYKCLRQASDPVHRPIEASDV